MKKLITLAAAATVAWVGTAWQPAMAADVGVSVQISQPGVYGRVDIGRFPSPTVVVQHPVIVHRAPPPPRYVRARPVQPVYMWVPPGHQKKWAKHCSSYGACGVPVVFVQDRWYRDHVVVPRRGYDERRWERRDDRRDDRRDRRDDRERDRYKGGGRDD